MIVKVCGLREPENINNVVGAGADMLGFILFPPSPRFIGNDCNIPATPQGIDRVGVFVNELFETIESWAIKLKLTHIQLHGSESVELCKQLKQKGYKVIKSISIESHKDFDQCKIYDGVVDLLLFDTKCKSYGGSGMSFDWSLIDYYIGFTPFLLSGGITPDMHKSIKAIKHNKLAGIDVNSGFEIKPALKDTNKVEQFIKNIKQ